MQKVNMDTPYTPIDCGYYDLIEATIMRRRAVILRYEDVNGHTTEETVRLLDTLVENGIEYVMLPEDRRLRMDRILSMDGQLRPGGGEACGRESA